MNRRSFAATFVALLTAPFARKVVATPDRPALTNPLLSDSLLALQRQYNAVQSALYETVALRANPETVTVRLPRRYLVHERIMQRATQAERDDLRFGGEQWSEADRR